MKIEHLSVLATVVVAFAASTALILNGQSELRRDMWAGQAEIRKDMRAGQAELRKDLGAVEAELRKDLRAVEAELRTRQEGIREDLKSLEVRLAVVEQRTAGLSGEPDVSVDRPAPAASPDGRHQSAGATLLLARTMTAPFRPMAGSGPTY